MTSCEVVDIGADHLVSLIADATGSRVVSVDVRTSEYSTSHPIDLVTANLADGRRIELVRKDLARSSLLPGALAAKPVHLHDPQREAHAYTTLLRRAPVGAPALVAVAMGGGRSWLLLERLHGVPLWQVGELEAWTAAARWIGSFHRLLQPAATRPAPCLLRHDRRFHEHWLVRAATGSPLRTHPQVGEVARAHGRAVARSLTGPRTVIHGELYPSNIVVEQGPSTTRVAPIDWETVAVGSPLTDLAALVSGWEPVARARMVAAYLEGAGPELAAALADPLDLLAAELLLAVQWLGWSRSWDPPTEHASDWLALAVALSDQLLATA